MRKLSTLLVTNQFGTEYQVKIILMQKSNSHRNFFLLYKEKKCSHISIEAMKKHYSIFMNHFLRKRFRESFTAMDGLRRKVHIEIEINAIYLLEKSVMKRDKNVFPHLCLSFPRNHIGVAFLV